MKPSNPPAGRALLFLTASLLWLAASSNALAITISRVTVVNANPAGFSVLWETSTPALPALSVYSDAAGAHSLAGKVGIEAFPLNASVLDAANDYEKRLGQTALRTKTRGFNLHMMRVTGCTPGATYYFQVRANGSDGNFAVYPTSGDLPSIVLPRANSFIKDPKQLIIDLPSSSLQGRLVTLKTEDGLVPLAAVVGDGVAANQVYFNLGELFAADGSGNLNSPGRLPVTMNILGRGLSSSQGHYALLIGSDFVVASVDARGFASEDQLFLKFGMTALTRGASSSIPITLLTGAQFDQIRVRLTLPPDLLDHLTVQPVAGVNATLTPLAPGQYDLLFTASAANPMTSLPTLATLGFQGVPGRQSAVVHVQPSDLSFHALNGANINFYTAPAGRVFLIGDQPILDAALNDAGARVTTVYGPPNSTVLVEATYVISQPVEWHNPVRVTLEGLSKVLVGPTSDGDMFYRAQNAP